MATTDSIIMAYVGYVVFRALYQMMITVASFEIASNITQNSYGLVFGFNTFLALGFQTILTMFENCRCTNQIFNHFFEEKNVLPNQI